MASAHQIVREVEQFYQSYIQAFNHQDVDKYSQCFALPYAYVRGGGLSVCHDNAELRMLCEQTFKGLKSRGWDRSEARQLRVWPLEENHAMILADVARFRIDNTILEQGRFGYTARHDGREWKILTIFLVSEAYLGPGDLPR